MELIVLLVLIAIAGALTFPFIKERLLAEKARRLNALHLVDGTESPSSFKHQEDSRDLSHGGIPKSPDAIP